MSNIKNGKLSQDVKPTARNSNKHTAAGMKALGNSMSQDGYVAPMTAAADGEILDGDARLETSFEKFGDDALIIHHDGTKPIVMVRDDIPDAQHPTARRIHYRANLTAWQNLDLDPEIVMADIEAGFDFEEIDISLPDLGDLLDGAVDGLLKDDLDPTPQDINSQYAIIIELDSEIEQVEAIEKIQGIGYECRALIS